MIEGVEVVSNLITRYAIFENVYLSKPSPAVDRLEAALIVLYTAVLTFLGNTVHYFGKSTVKRLAKSVVTMSDNSLDSILNNIHRVQQDVDREAHIVNAERQQNLSYNVENISLKLSEYLDFHKI